MCMPPQATALRKVGCQQPLAARTFHSCQSLPENCNHSSYKPTDPSTSWLCPKRISYMLSLALAALILAASVYTQLHKICQDLQVLFSTLQVMLSFPMLIQQAERYWALGLWRLLRKPLMALVSPPALPCQNSSWCGCKHVTAS